MEKKLYCNIITPERVVYEGNIDYVVVPAYDGELGFLYDHAPLISQLGVGEIRLKDGDDYEYIAVHGGFVEIMNNELTILAEEAFRKEDMDAREIQRKLDILVNTDKPRDYDERCRLENEINTLRIDLKFVTK